MSWIKFFIQRFMRLWPAHVFIIFMSAIWIQIPLINFHTERQTFPEILQILFLLQAWSQKSIVFWGLNGPSWSISVELFFYACFPLAMVLVVRFGALALLAVAFAVTALWIGFAESYLFDPAEPLSALALGYIFPLARIGEFFSGIALGYVFVKYLSNFDQGSRLVWTLVECVAIAFSIYTIGNLSSFSALSLSWGFGPVFVQWVGSSSGIFSFALNILVFAKSRGFISFLLSTGPLVFLGRISFATYLVHQPLIYHWLREVDPVQQSTAISIFGYILVVFALSYLIYRYIEIPGIYLGRKISGFITR
jgi:peptidoglycan/LPS O-acetylase OafA/YrhL